MSTHAKLSPSGAHGWMLCPGWESDPKSSPHARQGTAAHILAEKCLINNFLPEDFANTVIEVEGESILVDAEMIEGVDTYLRLISDLSELGGQTFVEVRAPLEHITGETGAHGTVDCCILQNNELIVIDFKYGMKHVEAQGNKQLLMYSSGLMELFDLVHEVKQLRTYVCQPRTGNISEASYSIEEILAFEQECKLAAMMHGISSKLVPGASQCNYCVHKSDCGALREFAYESVSGQFADLTAEPPDYEQMSGDVPELLSQAHGRIPLIKLWIDAVESRIFSELSAGRNIPGLKLVSGRKGSRKWTDESRVVEMLEESGVDHSLIYTSSVNSPAALEKLVKSKQLEKEVFTRISALTVQGDTKPVVALDTDSRPALDQARTQLFSNLDQE